jgi:hypothetical protein
MQLCAAVGVRKMLKKLVKGRLRCNGCLRNNYLTELKVDEPESRPSCPRTASNQNSVDPKVRSLIHPAVDMESSYLQVCVLVC